MILVEPPPPFLSHMRPPWDEKIEWYRGSTRSERAYSRRELAADFYVHAIGLAAACVGCIAIAERLAARRPPPIMAFSVSLYAFSLVTMLLCSTAFNVGQARFYQQRWVLRSFDHAGICLLIVGTYSPTMAVACTNRTLLFVWTIAVVSTAIKWTRWPAVDRLPVHVCSFLLMGWCCIIVWEHVTHAFSPWATNLFLVGGALYTVGLIPWAGMKGMEYGQLPPPFTAFHQLPPTSIAFYRLLSSLCRYHIAIWHVFVLVASACFFAVVYVEVRIAQCMHVLFACNLPCIYSLSLCMQILGIEHPDCGWKEAAEEHFNRHFNAVANLTLATFDQSFGASDYSGALYGAA